MIWCTLSTVNEYFGLRGNADWNSIPADERAALLQVATDRLESIPFRGDNKSRTTTRYNNASLSTNPPIPYNLLVAFCEMSLWVYTNPLQQQQIVSPSSRYNISAWLSDLPLIIQNALSGFVDGEVGKGKISRTGGSLSYSGGTNQSGGNISTVATQAPIIGDGTAADPVRLNGTARNPDHYYQRINITGTRTGGRIENINFVSGTDNPVNSANHFRISIIPKTNALSGILLNREFLTNFYGTMIYKVDQQVGVNFISEVIHHNTDINNGRPDLFSYRRVLRPSVLNEAGTLNLSEFDSAVVLPQGDPNEVVPISINLIVQASDIQNAANVPANNVGVNISNIRFIKAAVRFKQQNDIIGEKGDKGDDGTGGGGGGLTPEQSAAIAANTAKVGLGIGNVGNTNIANNAITSNKIAADNVGNRELGTVNAGSQGQYLRHGGGNVIEWATIAAGINGVKSLSLSGTTLTVTNDDDTTYNIILPTSGGGGGGITAVASDTSLTGNGTNTSPLGLAQSVIDLIAANTAKTGITSQQATAISSATTKLGTIETGAQVNAPPAADSITGSQVAHNTLTNVNIAPDAIGLSELSTSNSGTVGQVLTRQSGNMSWTTPASGGGFNPNAVVNASISGQVLTLTQQDSSTITVTIPSSSNVTINGLTIPPFPA